MKYIKTFEYGNRIFVNYVVGDYIEYYNDGNKKIGKILTRDEHDNDIYYLVEISNDKVGATSKKYITRKLTLEEIEQYELKKTADKYNL